MVCRIVVLAGLLAVPPEQAVQANQQAVDQFKKAASACLEARGYSVR